MHLSFSTRDRQVSLNKKKFETMKKNKKILNDPVYGFIDMPTGTMYEIVEHPYFQRLRRIKQLGMSCMVYPGATHSRFLHTLGSFHLTQNAVKTLIEKGVSISNEEADAVLFAILLHDIGHGPFSHALEGMFAPGIQHEEISMGFMHYYNKKYYGQLDLAIEVFSGRYKEHFLHDLVSSQLDTDRLDYLKRDSFFTGVSEGVISTDRIIKMLNVVNDELVVDIKGLYSVEKFLIARRLMYWQVYLHKTVVAAEQLMRNIITRARELAINKHEIFCSPALHFFLTCQNVSIDDQMLNQFANLDDTDIISAIKVWQHHSDLVLSKLSQMYIQRNLFKIELQKKPFDPQRIDDMQKGISKKMGISSEEARYFVVSDMLSNSAYAPDSGNISVLDKTGKVTDLAEASDMFDHEILSQTVRKYFLCYPK